MNERKRAIDKLSTREFQGNGTMTFAARSPQFLLVGKGGAYMAGNSGVAVSAFRRACVRKIGEICI